MMATLNPSAAHRTGMEHLETKVKQVDLRRDSAYPGSPLDEATAPASAFSKTFNNLSREEKLYAHHLAR